MNYNNYQISLWDEFKTPIIIFSMVLLVMIGLHNTFYTAFSIDSSKVDVAWSEVKETSRPIARTFAKQAEVVKTYVPRIVKAAEVQVVDEVVKSDAVQNEYVVIDGDISVSAAEFYHPKLTKVLSGSMVSGYLEVQNGEVKGLSVQLNTDETKNIGMQMISIGEAQIQGNIFVYEIEGNNYTATVYPTSPGEYMVSFVNGPWNGARVKFSTQTENQGEAEEMAQPETEVAPENDLAEQY